MLRCAPGPTSALPAAKSTPLTVSTSPRSVCCALRLASSFARAAALACSAARACSATDAWRRACSASPHLASGSAACGLGVASGRLGRAPRLLGIGIPRLRSRSQGLELAVTLLQKRGRDLFAELLHALLRLAGGAGHRRALALLLGEVAEVQPVVDVLRPFRDAQRLLRVDEPQRRVGLHVRIGLDLLIGGSGAFYLSLRGPLLLRCAARRDDQREDDRNDLTELNRTGTHLRTSR